MNGLPAPGVGTSTAHQLATVETMGLDALRAEWWRRFKADPHPRISADLLRRAITYRVQEAAFGGLRADIARKLASAAWASTTAPTAGLKSGTTLVREWHGRTHTIRTLDEGFEYEGQRYRSLSIIAREITGAAWSGPRFFGLVKPPKVTSAAERNAHA